jgi:hypothetical protein
VWVPRCLGTAWPAPAGSQPGGYVARVATRAPPQRPRTRHGRTWGSVGGIVAMGRQLPDRGQPLRRDAGAAGHNARERDTGEPGRGGRNGPVAISWAITCRIAATSLTSRRRGPWHKEANSARERGTGERRATGRRPNPPDRGQAAAGPLAAIVGLTGCHGVATPWPAHPGSLRRTQVAA